MEAPKEILEVVQSQMTETVVEKVSEGIAGNVAIGVLGAAVPVAGLVMLGGKLVDWFSSSNDGAEEALKEWEKTQSTPISGEEAHGFVNGYRWAKK